MWCSNRNRLSKTGGKKQYGYLKSDVKAIVNNIVTELSKDERISLLYDLWYEQRENIFKIYTQDLPNRIPLTDNKEFKSIKNAVIWEAMNILFEQSDEIDGYENAVVTEDTDEPKAEEIENSFTEKEKTSRIWRLYFEAKELLDTESETYNPNEAVKLLIQSSELGCTVAKYRLGKMFLLGENVPKNTDYGLRWLEYAVADGNQYAEYLLGKTLLYGKDAEQDLFHAEELLKSSSNKGNRYAKYTLGKAYLDGIYLPQNFSEAFRLLRTSANIGFTAAEYLYGKLLYKGEFIPKDIQKAIIYLERAVNKNNPYAAYLAGKLRLSEEEIKDISKAVKNFEIAADNGNDYAEYQLGKLYLYGKEIERDFDKAVAYLTSAAEHGNQYAEQLLHSIRSGRHWSVALGSLRLLQHISRILQNRLEDERKENGGCIDRKLRRKIDEKKQAHGIKQ